MSNVVNNTDFRSGELNSFYQEHLAIFDSIPAWIFYKSNDNKFIFVNKTFCEALGKTKGELEGKSLYDIFPKEQADAFWQDDKEVIHSGEPKRNIVEPTSTAVGVRWLQTDKIPYKNEKGEIIGVIGFAIDITDKINAEEKTNKSQVILQSIIDLLPIRIFWKDLELKYLGCNRVFANDAGKSSPEELLGKDDYQMGWKEQAELYRNDDFAVIKSNVSKLNYEEEQTTPQGNIMWLNTNKMPLTDGAGNVVGVLGTYIDITDRKLAQDELNRALEETRKVNELMIDRELKMIELKNTVRDLEEKLKSKSL